VRVGPLKIILDGSLGSQTARCFDAYPDVIGSRARGVLNHSLPELAGLMGRGWAAGLEPAVHAIGDEAVALALDAFEAVQCRGTIEHAQLVRAHDLRRLAGAGIAASVQPAHLCDDRDVAERLWAGRTSQAFPLKQLWDAGVVIRFGSDAPVTSLDPWQAIHAAVTRTSDDRAAWHAAECLTVEQAIGASVRTHIAVNQPADFAVLDADPLDMPVGELASMSVSATFVGGRATHMAL
jgi:predicted amidohydrolase YtcJ